MLCYTVLVYEDPEEHGALLLDTNQYAFRNGWTSRKSYLLTKQHRSPHGLRESVAPVKPSRTQCSARAMTKVELHRLVDALPDDVVAHLDHEGAVTLALVRAGDRLIVREIDPGQAWFWTPEWQAQERETDEDVAAGRLERFETDEALLAALDARLKPPDADS